MNLYEAYFDGSAKPNPGIMTIGGLIKKQGSTSIHSFSEELGYGTNNVAEYLAFIRLVNDAIKLDIKTIKIYGDSALVVNQVNRTWQANSKMRPYRNKAILLLEGIDTWQLEHIKRGLNMEADSLTR
jgi:ribonuclease HI